MLDRSVIWITLESVRQDHTTIDGYDRETTPELMQLATEGTAFNQCYSHDIWTRSSSASILTGHASSAHQTWSNNAKLPKEIRTIPEAFRDSGYHTVCISSNSQLSASTGLDRGFDDFHSLMRSTLREEAGTSAFAKWLLKLRQHSGGLTTDARQHCLGYLSNQIAKQHIDSAANNGPLFLYTHYNDSHHPYVPPVEWRDKFAEDLPISLKDAIELTLKISNELHKMIANPDLITDAELQALRVLYDSSISYVDSLVGDLASYAKSRLNNPIIVVTADHGEFFREQNLLAHMLVPDTAVSNVPLVVNGLADLPSRGFIQHADIMEILCSDLDINHPVPAGIDIREKERDFVVIQRGGERAQENAAEISKHDKSVIEDILYKDDLTTLQTENWHYQRSSKKAELFKSEDRSTNVIDEYPEKANNLDNYMDEWLETIGRPSGNVRNAEFTDEMEEQLRDMGYLQ